MKDASNSACLEIWLRRGARFLPLLFFNIKRSVCVFLLLGLAVFSRPVAAQSVYSQAYTFTTFAGEAAVGSADGIGTAALFYGDYGVAVDSAGNIYVADTYNDTIRKITPSGVVSTLAGAAGIPGSTDGTNSEALFNQPQGIAVDNASNLYVADTLNDTIRKLTPVGTNWVSATIAGFPGFAGTNDGPVGLFNNPSSVAVDATGNVYVADYYNYTIRKITPAGAVSTFAGLAGISGTNNGTGSSARFSFPYGVALDTTGNVYVTDSANSSIRTITPAGVVNTLARLPAGNPGFITGIGVDSNRNVYVADQEYDTIRKVTSAGVVTTFAGLATNSGSADGTGSSARFNSPFGVAVDNAGNVYVADTFNSTVREITPAGAVSTIAGATDSQGSADGNGSNGRFDNPTGVAVDSTGNLYVADYGNNTIRKITSAGVVSTLAGVAGIFGSTNGTGNQARFSEPYGVAVDRAGNLYVADSGNNTIRKITPALVVTNLAGLAGSPGTNDGTGSSARFNDPLAVTVDTNGNVYVADANNNTIRKITPAGQVSTLAGLGGFSGNADGTNSHARFGFPAGVAVDSGGNVYVADSTNNAIRKITPAGQVSTLTEGGKGSADGQGEVAQFYNPIGIAVDSASNVYVTDSFNFTIRKITPVGTNWVVSTIAGLTGSSNSVDGSGSVARFSSPHGIAVDANGNLFVADTKNNTIRKGVFTAYGTNNPVVYSQPPMSGQLVVVLEPPEANGQWRFAWDQFWRNSGDTVSNLAQANYPLIFRNEPGYLAYPATNTVAVLNNTNTYFTNQYLPTISNGTGGTGSLTVDITPNAPPGAGWQFIGATTSNAPGTTVSGLQPDTYYIQFEPVSGWSTPPIQGVQVAAGQNTTVFANYLLAQSRPADVLLATNTVNDVTDYPFGFNGQLVTDVGYGSGVAVQANVVLTAAHLLFNDYTLSYASQAYWYFEQEAGVSQPEPQIARGWYMLTDYASQRTNDLLGGYSADQSSPQSRNDDAAAVYFLSPCAGGAYAGYLPSDASSNVWLTGNALKMLVGYPVDGSDLGQSIVPGQMYYTQSQPYPLSPATDPVPDQQVYVAPWFLSFPGNSGGPLFVQLNGTYYPAGIYLGTAYNGVVPYASYVRGIDSAVVNLITNAAVYGDSGTNNGGPIGGVITIVPSQEISASKPGYLQVLIGPPAALAAGGAWKLGGQPDSAFSIGSNFTQAVITTNTIALQFRTNVPGWNPPTNQSVALFPNQFSTVNANYTVTNPVLYASPSGGIAITGTTGTTYRIDYSTNLLNGPWLPLQTNTLSAGNNVLLPPPSPTNPPAVFYRAVWLP